MTSGPIVIAGAGMAGGNAARTLREEGFEGPIAMIGDEPGVPFGRPPLSKTYLRGEESLSGWFVESFEWWAEHDVQRIHGRINQIDTQRRRVEIDGVEGMPYSKLLLATGGRNRRPGITGADRAGVYQLRTVADSDAIKSAARAGARAVIVGMGFIGCEVAASLRALGAEVTAAFPGRFPLGNVLGDEVGEAMASIHSEHGVTLMPQESVDRIDGGDRVERVHLKSGKSLDCDMVVIAVGIQPNTELTQGTGIAIDNGILVDAACRTNVPDVFAAGDVANSLHPLFDRVRVEHYNNAEKQGRAVAKSMLGSDAPYDYLYTFWSDQYDDKLEYVGHAPRWERFVIRGSMRDRTFIGFYLAGGILKAAVGLNRGGDPELEPKSEMAAAGRLVSEQARPDEAALIDESVDLSTL